MQDTTGQEEFRAVSAHALFLRRLSSGAALGFAIVFTAVKVIAWFATGSVALLTSAVDGLVDTAASLSTLIGVNYAARPADREHRYGHGKGEAISALLQSVFLALAALVLGAQSLHRLVVPERLTELWLGLWVTVAGLLAAVTLVGFQSWVLRRTGSVAIAADRSHYQTDIAVNLGVLLALATTGATGWQRADPAIALAIALYMLRNAWGIWRSALEQLLDRELPVPMRKRIRQEILAVPEVLGVHDLRTRASGELAFIEFHLEVDGQLSISQGHAVGDQVEAVVKSLFDGGAQIIAHLEPAGIDDERIDHRIRQLKRATGR